MAYRSYAPHEVLVGPARSRPEIWRMVGGLFLISAVAILMTNLLRSVLETTIQDYDPATWWLGNTPASLLVFLTSFAFTGFGTFVAAHFLHNRNPLGMIGPLSLTLRDFTRVVVYLFFLGIVLMVLPPYGGDSNPDIQANLPVATWLSLLPFALLALFIQVGVEELLFRGYIQQCLAARFRSPLAWMVAPSALFALGHYLPQEAGENAFLIAVWAGIFGILMADLTARSGTLGPAIAVHFVNNLSALLIVSLPDTMSGLALFTLTTSMSDVEALRPWLVIDFAIMFISWLGARVAIAR